MKTEIKNLRVRIDGLAQLTKELRPQSQYRLNLSEIPESLSADDAVEIFNRTGYSIDGCITPLPQCFKELEKATDSLFLAKAWLGKMLELLGSETPYENDGNRKTVEDIEPTADKYSINKLPLQDNNLKDYFSVTDGVNINWDKKPHIEKVDWLREQIKDIIELEQEFVYKYLSEAIFWLGFELERLKNEGNNYER